MWQMESSYIIADPGSDHTSAQFQAREIIRKTFRRSLSMKQNILRKYLRLNIEPYDRMTKIVCKYRASLSVDLRCDLCQK